MRKCYVWILLKQMHFEDDLLFFKLSFTTCKGEKPLRDMELKEKEEEKDKKDIGELIRKSPKKKRCL